MTETTTNQMTPDVEKFIRQECSQIFDLGRERGRADLRKLIILLLGSAFEGVTPRNYVEKLVELIRAKQNWPDRGDASELNLALGKITRQNERIHELVGRGDEFAVTIIRLQNQVRQKQNALDKLMNVIQKLHAENFEQGRRLRDIRAAQANLKRVQKRIAVRKPKRVKYVPKGKGLTK